MIRGNRGAGCPIIDAQIRYHALNGVTHPSGSIPFMRIKALVDTGATNVVTTPAIVKALGLPFAAKIDHTVVGGFSTVDASACDLVIGENSAVGFTVTDCLVLEATLTGYDAIIGWDALRFVTLAFAKNGDFTISW